VTGGIRLQPIGIITGLIHEADCLSALPADRRPRVRCSGADTARARDHARALIAEGCRGLLSFGIAGGLADGVVAGGLIVADCVIMPDGGRVPTAMSWREGLLAALAGDPSALVGPIVGSDRIVGTPAAKRALAAGTGAVAVDMESHAVAAVARESGVPFMAVRTISDPADSRIPDWAVGCIAADGSRRWGAIAVGVIGNPGDLSALIRLAGDRRKGMDCLRRVAGRAGPFFGLA
jgi:adenosylhomocysteine nucleosidase